MLLRAVLVAALIGGAGGIGGARAAGPNLLPNPGFEESAIEPGPLAGQSPQPVLPAGWAFEGAAGLFDHSPHGGSGGSARSAAISVPAGGKRAVCGPEIGCNDNPVTDPKAEAAAVLTVNPAWRNAVPVPVVAGATYELAVDLSWQLATEGEGAFGAVRWTVGDALPVLTTAFTVRSTVADSPYRDWGRVSGVVTAPAGATEAVVLLGATDDVFISQFRFDEVSFRAV